ncbi:SMP-30/gluconolactonase/LRE family protein [Candidatus Protochlamydia phocaeensis]|uniref:SMP-30/gluconolactonase/LRE family protein n=1 Tax=Candidatus Protochlamydia phocaeensis TaxID=1414722 RepID=UPI00083911B6|nr:SMP-30/gluconolactonase/LRE family protein [Candidatus Protochlamydia phocaeensis]
MEELKCVLKTEAILGESPVWSSSDQKLYWVDILRCRIFCFDPQTDQNQVVATLPQLVTAFAFCESGKFVLALAHGIGLLDRQSGKLDMISEPEKDRPDNRFNDGKCDRQGRFWCGTMNLVEPQKDTGNLYRLNRDRSLTGMQDHVKLTNGMGWSPDNRTMYFTETKRYAIFAYDFNPETGSITNRRVFVQLDANDFPVGGPDGLTVDQEGYVWSAHYGRGKIVRYSPEGVKERVITLPVPRPTSCAFGGENLDILFMTTARENMSREEIEQYPLSGSLFAVRTEVKGLPEAHYKDA